MDLELSSAFQQALTDQGMQFVLNARVTGGSVNPNGKGKPCKVNLLNNSDKKNFTIDCDCVLIATGRRPYTEGLQLDRIGIKTDRYGKISVNQNFET